MTIEEEMLKSLIVHSVKYDIIFAKANEPTITPVKN